MVPKSRTEARNIIEKARNSGVRELQDAAELVQGGLAVQPFETFASSLKSFIRAELTAHDPESFKSVIHHPLLWSDRLTAFDHLDDEPVSLAGIPKPSQMRATLDAYVLGQDFAKKALAVGVRNHYKRVNDPASTSRRTARVGSIRDDDVALDKTNITLVGPTGSGKTYCVETLARTLDVPYVAISATSLVQTGYVGMSVEEAIGKLYAASGGDVEKTEKGIFFIDEIDKLATKPGNTDRDVSGEGVQDGLLKIMQGAKVDVPIGGKRDGGRSVQVDTTNILFITAGAFAGIEEIVRERLNRQSSGGPTIGFGATPKDPAARTRAISSVEITAEDLRTFGMKPELIGRGGIIAPFEGLDVAALSDIFMTPRNAPGKQLIKIFEMEGATLVFEPGAVTAIAEAAFAMGTGARGLKNVAEKVLLDLMYDVPDHNNGQVKIVIDEAFVRGRLAGSAVEPTLHWL